MGGQETTSGDWDGLSGGFSSRCQGEGRGFESRRPLSVKRLLSGSSMVCLEGCGFASCAIGCPHGLPMVSVPFGDDSDHRDDAGLTRGNCVSVSVWITTAVATVVLVRVADCWREREFGKRC